MGIFKKDPVERLDEDQLREMYLLSKRSEKFTTVFFMIIYGLISIAVSSYAIGKEIYWLLAVPIILIILFIYLIGKFSRILEDVFENRILEEAPDEP